MTIDQTIYILSSVRCRALDFKWDYYKTRISVEKILRDRGNKGKGGKNNDNL